MMPYLEVQGIVKGWRGRRGVDGVSLSVGPGMVAVLGPNGAGKTTLLRILAGLLSPDRGKVFLNGVDAYEKPFHHRRRVGYKPQNLTVYGHPSTADLLMYLGRLKGIPEVLLPLRVAWALGTFGLERVASVPVAQLSRGLRQRLFLAQAMLGDPDLLILDEPTVGLDERTTQSLMGMLAAWAKERLVILSTHRIEPLSFTHVPVLVLYEGRKVFFGTAEALAAKAAGRVWSVSLPAGSPELERLLHQHEVIAQRQVPIKGYVEIRLIAVSKPHPDALPVTPGLEEGYRICLAEVKGR